VTDPLAEYAAVVERVQAFADQAAAAQAAHLVCAKGCDGCCRLRRTAFAVEIAAIRRHVQQLEPARVTALQARRDLPEVRAGARCVFLDDDGACAVYPARPIICRTHGPAVTSADSGVVWCQLTFADHPPEAVPALAPAGSVLDLDRINMLLSVVDTRYRAAHPQSTRAPLDAALESV
jgi:hypothetical protein